MEEKIYDTSAEKALTDRIIADAETEAERMLRSADEYYDRTTKSARAEADKYIEKAVSEAQSAAEDLVKRSATLDNIEYRKTLLGARQALVEEVFSRAEKSLENMGESDYLALIERLIASYAEAGDAIVLAENCPLDAREVENTVAAKKLNLKAQKTGKFGGGLVLSGKKTDKDLTFKALCAAAKESYEGEVAQKLFG